MNYFWIVLIVIYIISPFDAHPLFLDDLIAGVMLLYMLYKRSKEKVQRGQYYRSEQSRSTGGAGQKTGAGRQGVLNLEQAQRLFGVVSGSTADDINRAYRNKVAMSHPDKVSHLSKELQERARELTLELNEAYELLKRHKRS